MSLTLMYITNNPKVAEIAQSAGVDRIWVDMEWIGKEDRQAGMNTVKSHHTIEDIVNLRPIVTSSTLMARINPIHSATKEYGDSREEIESTIAAGAEVIMLPMFKTVKEVEKFVEYVSGRVKTQLLVETKEAHQSIDKILEVPGIDEVHIGLNDLHLSYGQRFMFEPLSDGKVEAMADKLNERGIKFGIGGIARLGKGILPAEYVIAEHYRLGSSAAILSRSFCDANNVENVESIRQLFIDEVKQIRLWEEKVKCFSVSDFERNKQYVQEKVIEIISK